MRDDGGGAVSAITVSSRELVVSVLCVWPFSALFSISDRRPSI